MTWQRALQTIRDYGFRNREVVARLGVTHAAVDFWWATIHGRAANRCHPDYRHGRLLIGWALGLLAGTELHRDEENR